MINCNEILERYFKGKSLRVLMMHGRMVAGLALEISDKCGVSPEERCFIEEAAMLHDIGVSQVCAPEIGLLGRHPYIMHGVLGREILEKEGLPRHALVAERHIGVGLTVVDIEKQGMPLPHRDMTPQSLPEKIICFSDLFFSKHPTKTEERKSVEKVRRKLGKFGDDKVRIFDEWQALFQSACTQSGE